MSYQSIGVGTLAGDGTGDTLRVGGTKVNANFTELYDMLGDGSDLTSGISVSGSTITLTTPIIAEIDSGSTITLDATTDIVLDADGGDIFFKDGGTTFGSATNTSGDLIIKSGTTTAATFSGANVTLAGTVTATTAFVPSASDGAALGTSSLEFSDLFLADGAVINFGDDQDITLTHSADTGLTTNGTFQATTITATTAVVPDASDGAVLGSASLEWSDLFLADGAVINFGDDQDVTLTHNADTGLTLNSVMVATTLEATGDTSAGDNAAIGYTSAEGLILTGQGSTSDLIIKNDTDGTVCFVPTGTGQLQFPDGAKILMGGSSDLSIYHDGSNSYINEAGTGQLYIKSNYVSFVNAAGSETMAAFDDDGAVTLYYDNTAALATKSGGGTLTGTWETTTALVPDASDGAALGTTALEWSDLYLADGAVIGFGDDQDITLTHVADTGLKLKHANSGDDKYPQLTLQTGDNDIAVSDKLGAIFFQAPDEGAGSDAALVAAGIEAVSEGDFSASNNATKLSFLTAASEAAAEKASLSSTGVFTATSFTGSGAGLTAGTTPIATLDIDGGTDIGAAIVDADLFIIDDGAGGTNRKTTAARVRTYVGFPAATVMLFQQASAPTGWTKLTATNSEALADASLRVVGSTSFDVGVNGSVAFTTAFASHTPSGSIAGNAGATTLQTAQIPSHTHTVGLGSDNKQGGSRTANAATAGTATVTSSATGGGGSHTHAGGNIAFTGNAVNLAVKYGDVFLASKEA